ncbi:G-protein coupled receptor 161-like [Branchiostoma lanceolatum]|uniref:G-protein coupled receptor 161-like n=1 Tax=Branchiostoma lanceolatum TaxID=7740 RepID=UPI003452B1DF
MVEGWITQNNMTNSTNPIWRLGTTPLQENASSNRFLENSTANGLPWTLSSSLDNSGDSVYTTQYVAGQTSAIILIFLASCVGNFLVAFTLWRKAYLLTVSNKFVFSLTVSNFLLSLLVFPFCAASAVLRRWIFGVVWCNFTGFVTILVSSASLLTLGIIAIDRYYAIVRPMMYPDIITPLRGYQLLFYIWLHATVIALPPLFGWGKYQFQVSKASCAVEWDRSLSYSIVWTTSCFVAPLLEMLFCYWHILKVARTKSRKIHVGNRGLDTDSPDSSLQCPLYVKTGKQWKAARTLVFVLGSFIIPWAPYATCLMYQAVQGPASVTPWIQSVVVCLSFCGSVCHPLMYGVWNRTVRKELVLLLCGDDRLYGRRGWRSGLGRRGRRESRTRALSISVRITDLGMSHQLIAAMSYSTTNGTENNGRRTSIHSDDSGTTLMTLEDSIGYGSPPATDTSLPSIPPIVTSLPNGTSDQNGATLSNGYPPTATNEDIYPLPLEKALQIGRRPSNTLIKASQRPSLESIDEGLCNASCLDSH